MSFRRDGKYEHEDQNAWKAWKSENSELLSQCGLPPNVLRSQETWDYLLQNGYWCEDYYGKHVGNIDFDLSELTVQQLAAFRILLENTLTDEERRQGCAAWHFVCPRN